MSAQTALSARQRRDILRELAIAERLRAKGKLSDSQYAAIAVWAALSLTSQAKLFARPDVLQGEVIQSRDWLWDSGNAIQDGDHPNLSAAERPQYGDIGDAARVVRERVSGCAPPGPNKDQAFIWSSALTETVKETRIRLGRADRVLRPVQERLDALNTRYPLLFKAVVWVTASIIASLLAFWLGTKRPTPPDQPTVKPSGTAKP